MTVNVTDIQFNGDALTDAKLRRFVQDVVAAERAINLLISQVSTLQTEVAASGGTEVLATTTSLGPNFTVSGLTAGMVLKALSATSAAFAKLKTTELGDTNIDSPVNGQVMTYVNGQWVNEVPPGAGAPTMGENIGSGVGVYAGIAGGALAFKSITGDGTTIGVNFTADTITLSYIGGGLTYAQASAITSIRI